ncbi:hypothetical protein AB0D99_32050 [Streptomyces sp. NPDC047971]|uniref:hypothetical protein n=1 Tax=Streptomyces sp. NPDC047971 TaxID=3154499 RepID=UPI0033C60870
MHRTDRFLISQKPYAIDLNSLRTTRRDGANGHHFWDGRIDGAWFRRRQGVTVACVGTLWDFQEQQPTSGREFVERHTDGRYGGDCDGRWDGERYWGAQHPTTIEEHLALLRPMLAAYPALPDGYDGWWTFHEPKTA